MSGNTLNTNTIKAFMCRYATFWFSLADIVGNIQHAGLTEARAYTTVLRILKAWRAAGIAESTQTGGQLKWRLTKEERDAVE